MCKLRWPLQTGAHVETTCRLRKLRLCPGRLVTGQTGKHCGGPQPLDNSQWAFALHSSGSAEGGDWRECAIQQQAALACWAPSMLLNRLLGRSIRAHLILLLLGFLLLRGHLTKQVQVLIVVIVVVVRASCIAETMSDVSSA